MEITGVKLRELSLERLDPKLRRLAYVGTAPAALDDAQRSAVVASEVTSGELSRAVAADAPMKPAKRVLVKHRTPETPNVLEEFSPYRLADFYSTADVPIDQLQRISQDAEVEFISGGNRMSVDLNTSLAETRADVVQAGTAQLSARTGTGIVVGVIDFGFDLSLDDFRDATGKTRVSFYWDQFSNPTGGQSSPAGFSYGVEYDQGSIDAALALGSAGDADLNALGLGRLQPEAHGTHVAGIAAGNGRSTDASFAANSFVGAAPEATLILVQPDSSDTRESFTDSNHVADGVAYIFEKATSLGLPCVINMSLGQNGNSHDGASVVEQAIDQLLLPESRALVLAAGNEHIWRGHSAGELTTGDVRVLHVKSGGGMPVPGGGFTGTGVNRTSDDVEIWYSSRDRFRVKVVHPNEDETAQVEPGNSMLFPMATGESVFVDSVRFSPMNGESQIAVSIIPRQVSPGSVVPVTAGIWKIVITCDEAVDGRFDAWIERDARDRRNNFADQAFFVGGDFVPDRTLGTPATSRRAISVANYNHRTHGVSASSSRGPTRDNRNKPEIAAPGTNILSSNSLGGRQRNGATVPVRTDMSGTSMAAPHVAGIVALLLEQQPKLASAQIQSILKASARPPVGVATRTFRNDFGYGAIDAERALELVSEFVI